MSYPRNTLILIFILLASVGIVFILAWRNATWSVKYTDLTTILTTTTATFGTLLGIITAGLMFTQGKFSELASELSERSPSYLAKTLSLERAQASGSSLLTLRKTFSQFEIETTVEEEKNLYRRIIEKTSHMFIDFAVLVGLRLRQEGLPDTGFLVSDMDAEIYKGIQTEKRKLKKEWQILAAFKHITDIWEGAGSSIIVEESERATSLQSDLRGAISILELKQKIDKGTKDIHNEVANMLDALEQEIRRIEKQLHEDRIPQLLSQMQDSNALRGSYFYLTLIFIAVPLFADLLILPQLSESTAPFFQQVIIVTSLLSVFGVIFLLVYIHKLLSA
jgi:hypothetical protein